MKQPDRIDNDFLTQFQGFQDFRSRSGTRGGGSRRPEHDTSEIHADGVLLEDPGERLNAAYREIRAALATDLLVQVK